MWTEEERKFKVLQRHAFFNQVPTSNSYLTLCGVDCEDIKVGIQKKILDKKHTLLTAVERDSRYFDEICKYLALNWSDKRFRVHHSDLHNVKELDDFDLVFLDYLGNLTQHDVHWVREYLAQHLLPAACLGITVSTSYRHNLFIPAIQMLLEKEFPEELFRQSRDISELGRYPNKMLKFLTTYKILIDCHLFPTFGYKLKIDYYKERESPYTMVLIKLSQMEKDVDRPSKVQKSIDKKIDILVKSMRSSPKGVRMLTRNGVATDNATNEQISGIAVINALINAETKTNKSAATRKLKLFVAQEAKANPDKNPKMIEAGIKAQVTRRARL